MTDFASLGLNPLLTRVINEAGYTAPTEIQTRAVPEVMSGKDVMACAQTGTGKTAAFVLPCIHRLISAPSQSQRHGPRVLVLTPTRELAQQVTDNVHKFSKGLRIRSGVVVGGVSYGPQYRLLTQPLDILVATPGRLIDHLNEGRVDFSRVETLVLDEADRMLDMGFLKPVERILDAVCKATARPQILLFSATFTDSVEKVATRVLQTPARIQLVAPKQNHKLITQRVFQADDKEHKMSLLAEMLKDPEMGQVIVFAATKRSADRMAEQLERVGHKAAAMHGDMKQNARKRVLAQMHEGRLKVLVATDVAARGIDVKMLSHVINFDMPQVAEDYVHRIGRTGRAGETGIAMSLITPEDLPLWKDIEKLLDKSFAFERIEGFEPRMSVEDFRATNMPRPQRGRKPQGGGQRGGFRGNGGGGRREGGFGGPRREFGNRSGGFGGGRREGGFGGGEGRREGGFSDRPRRDFNAPRDEGRGSAPRSDRPRRDFGDRPARPSGEGFSGERKSFGGGQRFDRGGDRPHGNRNGSGQGAPRDRGPRNWR